MNKNFSRVLKSFAEDEKEEIPPYSEYLEKIHKSMLSAPEKSSKEYGVSPVDYYLVYNQTELNDGNYDSNSIQSMFGDYVEKVEWNKPDPLHMDVEIGTVSLFYPELYVNAVVTRNEKQGLSIFVKNGDFKKIKDKLDSIETNEKDAGEELPPVPEGAV